MGQFAFVVGLRFRIDGSPHQLVAYDDSGRRWQALKLTNSTIGWHTLGELEGLYATGRLKPDTATPPLRPDGRPGPKRPRPLVADLPAAERDAVVQKTKLVRLVDEHSRPSEKVTNLQTTIDEVCQHIGMKPISIPTYYRYRQILARLGAYELRDKTGRKGNRNKLHAITRRHMDAGIKSIMLTAPVGTGRDVQEYVREQIAAELRTDPSLAKELAASPPLRAPSLPTIYEHYDKIPAYDRALAKFGPDKAAALHRGNHPKEKPTTILMNVEVDDTLLPFFVIDEDRGIPLGRPYLHWSIDAYSFMPTSCLLLYEPPSDFTTLCLVKHAILPKAYVRDLYPEIQMPWLARGKFSLLTLDGALQNHSANIDALGVDLDFDTSYTLRRRPWFKPEVEGIFNILNQDLLRRMPGNAVLKAIPRIHYDPEKHAVVGHRFLDFIIHMWVIDVFCQMPHGPWRRPPHDVWLEEEAKRTLYLHDELDDLDAIYGLERVVRLNHKGIRFENIFYYDEVLDDIRFRCGHELWVTIKVNPIDLGVIRVKDPQYGGYLPVRARHYEYASGMSLYFHQLVWRHAYREYKSKSEGTFLRARRDLFRLMNDGIRSMAGLRENRLIARAQGIGSATSLFNLDHTGRLVDFAGPLAELSCSIAKPVWSDNGGEPISPDPFPPPPAATDRSPVGDAPAKLPAPVLQVPERRLSKLSVTRKG